MKINEAIDKRFPAIIDAVCYWLGYQFKIGREQLIHEASLRYPVADTITSKGIAINRVILEKLHPLFMSKKIDLVIFGKTVNEPDNEVDDRNLEEVYEFKLAKNDTGKANSEEHQRVFDDVVRLAYYHMWGNKDCYFLMCGEYGDFKTFFIDQNDNIIKKENGKSVVKQKKIEQPKEGGHLEDEFWKSDGLYSGWFDFKIGGEKEFEIKTSDDNDGWGLKVFQNNYIPRDKKMTFTDSITIKTTCLAITPPGLENIKTHAAGIWKIETVPTLETLA